MGYVCNLHPRQRHSCTPMPPSSKTEMRGEIFSVQDELIRVWKYQRVAVGSRVRKGNWFSWVDLSAMQRNRSGCCAREASIWGVEAYELLRCGRNQAEVRSQLCLKLLVFRQVVAYCSDQEGWSDHSNNERLAEADSRSC